MDGLNDFLRYIRFNLCLFSVFIAVSGYLVHNAPSKDMLFVALTSFFLCAGAYSYNNITDQKEDIVNRGKANPFASSAEGKVIVFLAFFFGFLSSFFLTPLSILFSAINVLTSLAYSAFRIKKHLLIKNIYSGFGVAQVFLIGAAAFSITKEILFFYFLISFFIMVESIISDLRDYKGDKVSGIDTIPVSLGYDKTRHLVILLLAAYLIPISLYAKLAVLLPFVFLMLFAVARNNPALAHSFGSFSLMFLALRMMF